MINKESSQKALKLAFIGGGIGSAIGYTHYIASQMDHQFEVVAGCFSRSEDVNKKTADLWGINYKRIYCSWEELLEKEKDSIDAVVILTPTPDHFEIIMKALSLNYALISEKPLASSFEQGFMIHKTCVEKRSFLAVTYNYTGYPMLRELKKLIDIGRLGDIKNINIEMPQESFIRLVDGKKPTPQAWRLSDGCISTISLDLGSHLHQMVYYLTGEFPKELVSDESTSGLYPEVIDNVYCILKYANGMRCNMWYGKSLLGHRNGLRIRIYGTKASAEWFQMQPEELFLNTINGERIILDRASENINIANQKRYTRFKAGHPAGFIEAFANLYYDLAKELRRYKQGLLNDSSWPYGTKQAVIGLKVFEAIKKSSIDKRWVTLNDWN